MTPDRHLGYVTILLSCSIAKLVATVLYFSVCACVYMCVCVCVITSLPLSCLFIELLPLTNVDQTCSSLSVLMLQLLETLRG